MQARDVPIEMCSFRKSRFTQDEENELGLVSALAIRLRDFLVANEAAIEEAHVFGAKSSSIQSLVGEVLADAGFSEEVVLMPGEGFATRARPDFFFSIGPGRGVIAEVERGGTVNNNHDLKDIWKAHVAENAQHLFLIVPNSNFKEDGSPRERPFARVVARMGSFFGAPRREIDILSLHVFGYGRLS